MEKVIKVDRITDDLVDLFVRCFKDDIIYNSRDNEILKNEELIKKMFCIYLDYGTILTTRRYKKSISFLGALNVKRILEDEEAFDIMFNKEKYPEINNFIRKVNYNGKYIVVLGVDKTFRSRGLATKLVKHYMRYYRKGDLIYADVDNKYSLKIFKKLKFKTEQVGKNYYIVYNEK